MSTTKASLDRKLKVLNEGFHESLEKAESGKGLDFEKSVFKRYDQFYTNERYFTKHFRIIRKEHQVKTEIDTTQLISLNTRLDEILEQLDSKVAHKVDIVNTETRIVEKLKEENESLKRLLEDVKNELSDRSYQKIFSFFNYIGLLVSLIILAYLMFYGEAVIGVFGSIAIATMFVFTTLISKLLRK